MVMFQPSITTPPGGVSRGQVLNDLRSNPPFLPAASAPKQCGASPEFNPQNLCPSVVLFCLGSASPRSVGLRNPAVSGNGRFAGEFPVLCRLAGSGRTGAIKK